MKKYLFIAVAALAASVACTEVNTENPGDRIIFQAANYVPATKVSAADPSFTSFPCKGYLHAEGINLNASYAPTEALGFQNFFGNSSTTPEYTETISFHDGTPVTWTPSHDYYWPKSSHSYINFVAWYGVNSAGSASNPTITYAWNTDKYVATLSWAFTQGAVGNTTSDYLYADVAWRFNSNNDPATYTSVSRVSEGVPMLFHHALAKINVKAYAVEATETPANPAVSAGSGTVTDGLATWTIVLEDVAIDNVYTAGTLSMTNADPGSASTAQAWTKSGTGWTGTGSVGTIAPASNTTIDKVTKATANDVIAETCVLPQSLASSHLTGKVRITTTYSNASNVELIPFDLTLSSNLGTATWEQNYKYTYYLKINPAQKKIYFDPAIESDYQDGTTTEQVIPNE